METPPRLKEVEKALGEKAEKWDGRCYEIAASIVEKGLVKGIAVYGHWLGFVDKKSSFYSQSRAGFCRHGWVVLANGMILDPTRWVFEGKKPYIYIGPGDDKDYDEGGNAIRRLLRGNPPQFDMSEKCYRITHRIADSDTWSFIEEFLEHAPREDNADAPIDMLSRSQMFWLATAPLEDLGKHAKSVYAVFEKLDCVAMIPIDNYKRVQDGRWPGVERAFTRPLFSSEVE